MLSEVSLCAFSPRRWALDTPMVHGTDIYSHLRPATTSTKSGLQRRAIPPRLRHSNSSEPYAGMMLGLDWKHLFWLVKLEHGFGCVSCGQTQRSETWIFGKGTGWVYIIIIEVWCGWQVLGDMYSLDTGRTCHHLPQSEFFHSFVSVPSLHTASSKIST